MFLQDLEDVTTLYEKVARLKSKKTNILEEMRDFAANSHEFGKLASSAGALVAAGVHQDFAPGSDEEKALAKLQDVMMGPPQEDGLRAHSTIQNLLQNSL